MGKQDVLNILKKSSRPLTSTEIAKKLPINARSVRRALSNMVEHSNNINFKKLSQSKRRRKYSKKVKNSSWVRVYSLNR